MKREYYRRAKIAAKMATKIVQIRKMVNGCFRAAA
jgi:hypothetical protein